jgi:dTDP-glucose 4,6-dehydratase
MAYELEHDLNHVLAHTEGIWDPVKGTKVFVTGGTCFVGQWLIDSFVWANRRLNLNARLFVLTRDPKAFDERQPTLIGNRAVEILRGDIKTTGFPEDEFQFVIHAAHEHSPARSSANFEGTRRVVEMAKTHGTRRFLYVSSGAVYGEQPIEIGMVTEDTVPASGTLTCYGEAKRESEAWSLRESDSTLGVVIARLFAFIGPYLPLGRNFAAGNFVRDARLGGPIHVEGDGTPLRSYLYAADVAIWLWTLLLKGTAGRSYNVGSDHAISILDLAKKVERVCGVTRGIRVAQEAVEGARPKRYVPSIARARTELGLEPWIGLEEGVRRMFNWHDSP